MKTGGTTVRRMLEEAVGPGAMFPSQTELDRRPGGYYPTVREIDAELHRSGLPAARVVAGHYPAVLADSFPTRPLVVTVLRDPVERTLSMLDHRRRHTPALSDHSYLDLLDLDDFVDRQLRDYQTRVFAFDDIAECPDTVHEPLGIDDDRFERAVARLRAADVVGTTDRLEETMAAIADRTDLRFGAMRAENVTRPRGWRPTLRRLLGRGPRVPARETVTAEVRRQIESLTERDRVLYSMAVEQTIG